MNEPLYAKRLMAVLEDKRPDMHCPDGDYNKQRYPGKSENEDSATCIECTAFIAMRYYGCPCNILGCREAVKRAWIALEEKGYLD